MEMAMSIRNRKTEALARKVAAAANEGLTEAVTRALEERLAKLQARRTGEALADQILAIGRRCAALPDIDTRAADDILGYRPDGTFD